MSNTTAARKSTSAVTVRKSAEVTVRKSAEVIAEAHGKVTETDSKLRSRALRNAAEDACVAEYGPLTITDTIALPEGEAFKAWISGAVGRNGFLVKGRMGENVPMGKTTIESMLSRNPDAFTNAAAFKIGAAGSGKRGKVTLSANV